VAESPADSEMPVSALRDCRLSDDEILFPTVKKAGEHHHQQQQHDDVMTTDEWRRRRRTMVDVAHRTSESSGAGSSIVLSDSTLSSDTGSFLLFVVI